MKFPWVKSLFWVWYKMVLTKNRTISIQNTFLAHLNWRLMLAFLIEIYQLSVIVIIFSHFKFLLQNYCAKYNQTWHKASFGKLDHTFFQRGGDKEIVINSLTKFKNLFLQNHWANFYQRLWVKGIQVFTNIKGTFISQKRDTDNVFFLF